MRSRHPRGMSSQHVLKPPLIALDLDWNKAVRVPVSNSLGAMGSAADLTVQGNSWLQQ